jgi:hypothetical protein
MAFGTGTTMFGRRRGSLRSRVARLEEQVAAQPAAPPRERPIVMVRQRAGEPVSEAPPGAFVIRIVRPAGAPDLDPETGSLPRRQRSLALAATSFTI